MRRWCEEQWNAAAAAAWNMFCSSHRIIALLSNGSRSNDACAVAALCFLVWDDVSMPSRHRSIVDIRAGQAVHYFACIIPSRVCRYKERRREWERKGVDERWLGGCRRPWRPLLNQQRKRKEEKKASPYGLIIRVEQQQQQQQQPVCIHIKKKKSL